MRQLKPRHFMLGGIVDCLPLLFSDSLEMTTKRPILSPNLQFGCSSCKETACMFLLALCIQFLLINHLEEILSSFNVQGLELLLQILQPFLGGTEGRRKACYDLCLSGSFCGIR